MAATSPPVWVSITGKGAHILTIDDPVKNAEANSADLREKLWEVVHLHGLHPSGPRWWRAGHPDLLARRRPGR